MNPARVLIALLALVACSPTFNWREATAEGGGIVALFPCRPDRHARAVVVAAAKVQMRMLVCEAGGATYALSFIDVAEPSGVAPALDDLRAVALSNIGAVDPQTLGLRVGGMTSSAQAVRLVLTGRLPDGAAVQAQTAIFSKDLRVYQASVIGSTLPTEAVDVFFAGLKFPA